ncbi:MAG: ATP synthase F1 subunit gamma [Planctomycetes bacterium RBG_16_59_8]|nr:MAG: ATP synthase F1 subunit gamma [Planctomycetes bacterium RBG_16_59_8]
MPAVQSVRTIRRKIRSVNNIKKITRAMQMVSAAKLRKVQDRLMAVRPYADKIGEFLGELVPQVRDLRYPLFVPREQVKNVAVVMIMADKGLCGSFNANLARVATNFMLERTIPIRTMAIGKKSLDFLRKRKETPFRSIVDVPTEIPFSQIREMTRSLVALFERGEVDEVFVLYTRYVNAMTFRPSIFKFLPVEPDRVKGVEASHDEAREYIFEPGPGEILEKLIPRYVEVTFHRLLLESMSSEHAARMNAMKNATDNAEELVGDLTLTYNKARQSGITKELLDIVGGAEALK